MKTILQEIVTTEVNRNYVSEKVFYASSLQITQQSWNRWKKGERGFSEDKTNRIKALFAPYEWMLVQKIDSEMNMYPQNFKEEPYAVYQNAKLQTAKTWANNGASISVNSARNVDGPVDDRKSPGTVLKVEKKFDNGLINSSDVLTFNINVSSAEVPAGKQNRLEWFNENFEDVIL